MRKIWQFIMKNIQQILLVLAGFIASALIFTRRKETDLLSDIENKIDNTEQESKAKADEFRAKLEIVGTISNKLERMEALLRLWQELDQE